ncbi:MAG TPA: response regulator transcription factor [Solirubrobacterales bacterium]|nr:response regulator transcription factor [Solirubrobacterales bacterium]
MPSPSDNGAGRVLVVDDEPTIVEIVGRYLERAGYEASGAGDGFEAIERAAARRPDLVVLDLMLPGIDGIEVMRRLRELPGPPLAVILLTARGEESDRLVGLRQGADDYVVKPFSPAELVARVGAVLRRTRPAETDAEEPPIELGPLRIEPASRRVILDGEEVGLTMREFDLLAFLAAHPGRVYSRDQLMESVWGEPYFEDTSTVTVHIRRLRAKLGDDPAEPRFIETVWGVGYRLRP